MYLGHVSGRKVVPDCRRLGSSASDCRLQKGYPLCACQHTDIGFQVERDKTEFLKKIGLTEKELDTLYEENTILKNQNLELEVITTQTIDTKL